MRRNISIKILVILIAVVLWFQQVLLKSHTEEILIPIRFNNIPENLVVLEENIKEIPVTINTRGMDFLIMKLSQVYFEIDAGKFKYGNNFIQVNDQNLHHSDRITLDIKKINSSKNTIIETDKLIKKRIPIQIQYDTFKDEEFFLQNKIINSSQKIEVEGPQAILNKYKLIRTKKISRKMIKDNKLTVALITPEPKMNLEKDHISLEITQSKMVTKTISLIPVRYPLNKNISIIPQKVSAMVRGPEDILEKLTNKNVSASIEEGKIDKNDFVRVKFSLPAGVKLVEYTPQKIQVIRDK